MDQLGWDSCDIILVSGDAYVDLPSFANAVIGRFLESQGFRVGIIAQPDWTNLDSFKALGEPNLFFGVTAGNMDSMINHYTADKRKRSDDAYTPGNVAGKRPDRAVVVYSQKCKEAYKNVPIVLGGIEASLRRIAQYDYWDDDVRRSVLIDSGADLLVYGNGERTIAEIAHRLSRNEAIADINNIRGTALLKTPEASWTEIDSSRIDWPSQHDAFINPYTQAQFEPDWAKDKETPEPTPLDEGESAVKWIPAPYQSKSKPNKKTTYIRLPSYEKVKNDSALYAHASRVIHQESNPYNALPIVQKHGTQDVWVNPPQIPLETDELDGVVFDLTYQRVPHPSYGDAKIPAYEMIRFSVNIMRGCFGGCTFCSITEHEGRIIQSRSEESILNEIEMIRDKTPGFTGTISDLGGPTANMYRLNCNDKQIEASCKRLSCVYPTICKNLNTDHSPTTQLYRKARDLDGVKKVVVASGLRYDLAVKDPEYVKELVTHHVGGYLKIAPEHSEEGTLSKMMKPSMDSYHEFKGMFDKYSKEAGKKQYLIPYFIAAHPGCEDEDMINLALWLKQNDFKVDQVQTFYPTPMALATAMYRSDKNPLKKLSYKSEKLFTAKTIDQRRRQKAFLRYHDDSNWPSLRTRLKELNLGHLIGNGHEHLIPAEQSKPKRGKR